MLLDFNTHPLEIVIEYSFVNFWQLLFKIYQLFKEKYTNNNNEILIWRTQE